jgi:hypothetical protein
MIVSHAGPANGQAPAFLTACQLIQTRRSVATTRRDGSGFGASTSAPTDMGALDTASQRPWRHRTELCQGLVGNKKRLRDFGRER